jgi:hypothetical protein
MRVGARHVQARERVVGRPIERQLVAALSTSLSQSEAALRIASSGCTLRARPAREAASARSPIAVS